MPAIKVLVVDDSVVVRRLVTDALSADPSIEVVGSAANGKLALAKWQQLKPDAITMDIEMPEMNGIEAVRELRKLGCRVPIIMFSTLTERGATATLEALSAGATDYVTKPANVGSVQEAQRSVREQLVPIIRGLMPRSMGLSSLPRPLAGGSGGAAAAGGISTPAMGGSGLAHYAGPVKLHDRTGMTDKPVRLVVLGSSTGGPAALSTVISGITKPLTVPMVITQHMPPVFTAQLANRLDKLTPSAVCEAQEGQTLQPGHIYIAPGDFHMEFSGNAGAARIRLTKTPPVNFCRPSVDVMFSAAVKLFGGDLLGVVLTGMGADGRNGCGEILAAGGRTLVQDERTSVVWGMPGAVATSGYADEILPIESIAGAINRIVANQGGRP